MEVRLARPFPLYDPSIGDMGSLRQVVDARDYLILANAYYQQRLDLKRRKGVSPVERKELAALRRICEYQKRRLSACERALGVHSGFRASYFEEYPDAAPLSQKPR